MVTCKKQSVHELTGRCHQCHQCPSEQGDVCKCGRGLNVADPFWWDSDDSGDSLNKTISNQLLKESKTVTSTVTSPVTVSAKSRKKVEDHIQAAVAMVLDELGLLWFHVPNELGGMISVGHLGQLLAMGLKPGVSDCIILDCPPQMFGLNLIALELKAPGGRVKPDQKTFIERVSMREGGLGKVTFGLAETLKWLEETCGWDVTAALSRLAARGYVIEGERMVRLPQKGSRARRSPERG